MRKNFLYYHYNTKHFYIAALKSNGFNNFIPSSLIHAIMADFKTPAG